MNNKLLINLLLLLLVVGLGLVAWLQPGKEAPPQLQSLTERNPQGLRRLLIEPSGGQPLRFERRDGQWQMLKPYAMPANGTRLDALARVVEAPVLSAFPLPEARRAEFGLDKPLRLTLDDLLFEFGGNEPINYHRYIAHEGRLALTVDRFYHHLSAAAEQLLSPALLPVGARLASIQTPNYRLEHEASGWRLQPAVDGLSADQLADRATAWSAAQGLSVRHFDRPEGEQRVLLRLESGAQFEFLILQQEQTTWLVRPDNGIGYQLPAGSDLLESPQAPQPPSEEAAKGDA